MAADTGGNVEGSVANEEVVINGVTVIGQSNLPNNVCRHASIMYASNLYNLVSEYWDKENNNLVLNQDDDIIQGCLITHGGEIINETIKNLNR